MNLVIDGLLNPELGLEIEVNLDLGYTEITELPENLSVGGSLDISHTKITELPENLSVGGSLYLRNTVITELPENLSVGGSLFIRNTKITSLPENLSVGGSLYLGNTKITNYPVAYNCGREKRAIYLDLKDRTLIRIGCFKGTLEEAVKAIEAKYTGTEATDYIAKVHECFALNHSL